MTPRILASTAVLVPSLAHSTAPCSPRAATARRGHLHRRIRDLVVIHIFSGDPAPPHQLGELVFGALPSQRVASLGERHPCPVAVRQNDSTSSVTQFDQAFELICCSFFSCDHQVLIGAPVQL